MKQKINKRKLLTLVLAIALIITMLPTSLVLADGSKYTLEPNEADEFVVVNNPNGGAKLSYSSKSALDLIEVIDGGNTYAFKDLNGDGKLNPYEDWRLPYEERAEDIAERMSLEQIAGLMLFSPHQSAIAKELTAAQKNFLRNDNVRAVLNANSNASVRNTAEWSNSMQAFVESMGLGIPVNFSSDPRHTIPGGAYSGGSQKISKWPGTLGFAATFDSDLVEEFSKVASEEYRNMGITTGLSPQIDLGTEPRWNRINGTYGESSSISVDMARAYVDGFQSTFNDGEDVGWGSGSVATMIKHWPGDATGEGGRESHSNVGKYAVYPGDNFKEHLLPFTEGGFKLKGKTGTAASVMPSYSISIGSDGTPIDGEGLGSGYSKYKLTDLLRGEYEFDGVICSDWQITANMSWGVEKLTVVERHYKAIMNGLDMFGGNSAKQPILDAYNILAAEDGTQAEMWAMMEKIGYRVTLNMYRLGLFEDSYINVEDAVKVCGNDDFKAAGYEAMKKSVVMLKNKDNIIKKAGSEKRTVYVPMVIKSASAAVTDPETGFVLVPAKPKRWEPAVEYAEKYFNVVTDLLSDGAPWEGESVSQGDLVKRTNFDGVEFAFAFIDSPVNTGSMFAGYGYDSAARNVEKIISGDLPAGTTPDNGYRPKTLQYREYYADPTNVREFPLGVDASEEELWVEAGGTAGKSRYYGGKSAGVRNETDLDYILELAELDIPVVVGVKAASPMVFNEFEHLVDGIVVGFSSGDEAMVETVAGTNEPTGLLPFQMPANMETVETQEEDVAFDMESHVDSEGFVYDFGYGLDWNGRIYDARTIKYNVTIHNPPVTEADDLDTSLLEFFIDYADKLVEDGKLKDVIEGVVKIFNKALSEAKDVMKNVETTPGEVNQYTVDQASEKLLNAFSLLELKGNKSTLRKLVSLSEKFEKDKAKYIPSTYTPFEAALKAAKDILADEYALQDEIQPAWDALAKAVAGLRVIPNRDNLIGALSRAKAVSSSGYTAASFAVLRTAIEEADKLLALPDTELSDDNLTKATNKVDKAISDLVKLDAPITTEVPTTEAAVKAVADTKTIADTTTKKAVTAPKTGETSYLGFVSILVVLCLAVVTSIAKKKSEDK